ncbi:MAG: Crp/Fnr family transcriptional regulator [Chloroflexota bacterium]|jgi:CRP-like cAMP-binding protein
MISPEVLRRFPFFSFMRHDQLREVAMITDEVKKKKGQILFNADEDANYCYVLLEGAIDLHFIVVDENEPELRNEFVVGTINPGEVLGISAVIEPYVYTTTAVVIHDSRLLKIDAVALNELGGSDAELDNGLQRMVAKATMQRLHATRVLLAAATGPE